MPKCKAKSSRTGKPCGQPAISGAVVCRIHGGSAPQVREAARARILSLVDPALGVLAQSVRKRMKKDWEPTAVEISAAKEILDRAGISKSATAREFLQLEAQAQGQTTEAPEAGFVGTLEELLVTYRRVTVTAKESD